MRVVVVGATGNVGSAVLRALDADPQVSEIVGVARHVPIHDGRKKITWRRADVIKSPLDQIFKDVDAVVHLAWVIQPARNEEKLRQINVDGSRHVFEAAAAARVKRLVYASSSGVYSPGPKDKAVDESWPRDGIGSAFYSRHKAETERILDQIEHANPELEVVRLRPGLIFQRSAADDIHAFFIGKLLPKGLISPRLIRFVPNNPRLALQVVHTDDIAEAYRLAITNETARGAYNVTAAPALSGKELAEMFHAIRVPVSDTLLRAGASVTWKLHLQPTSPGWVDTGLKGPLLSADRIRNELGWKPKMSAQEAIFDLLAGMHD